MVANEINNNTTATTIKGQERLNCVFEEVGMDCSIKIYTMAPICYNPSIKKFNKKKKTSLILNFLLK